MADGSKLPEGFQLSKPEVDSILVGNAHKQRLLARIAAPFAETLRKIKEKRAREAKEAVQNFEDELLH